ncbi:hypothetical protein Tamer19_34030 [Cupriavidus sp. TA19]|nr:hypothetical protein Tamer19_34030 [Cupriavidus sp. TA19]
MLDGLHDQGKLNHIATPANIEFAAALNEAIHQETHAGRLSLGEQSALVAKLRNLTSQQARLRQRDESARERGNRKRRAFSDEEAALVKVELDRLVAERSRPGVKLDMEPLYREVVARLMKREVIAGRSIEAKTRTIRRIHQGKY